MAVTEKKEAERTAASKKYSGFGATLEPCARRKKEEDEAKKRTTLFYFLSGKEGLLPRGRAENNDRASDHRLDRTPITDDACEEGNMTR